MDRNFVAIWFECILAPPCCLCLNAPSGAVPGGVGGAPVLVPVFLRLCSTLAPLQMWTSAWKRAMRSWPATTTATITSGGTTAPADLATSCTLTTGPAKVRPSSGLCQRHQAAGTDHAALSATLGSLALRANLPSLACVCFPCPPPSWDLGSTLAMHSLLRVSE